MSILQSVSRLGRFIRGGRFWRRDDAHCVAARLRICQFENLEDRNPLTANPFPDIHLGAVYLEPASGDDSAPNVIQVTFQGGAPGTQLSQIVINGDKDGNGKYSSGELFFDTAPGGQGVFGSSPFKVVQANGFSVTSVQVVDGGQQLVVNLQNFVAGDKLIFSIDVDEVNFVPSDGSAPDINAVVEGDEFQRSIMTGNFVAPHYQNATGQALFWDSFDQNFATIDQSSGTTLDLPPDSYVPPLTADDSDFTAGAVLQLAQTPLPSSISGTVYYDQNLSNQLDSGEAGIANVTLTLLSWNGSQWVGTGQTTTTDASGNYSFSNLLPGDYRVAETQPAGWLSVGSQPGTVDGATDGTSLDVDDLGNIVLLGGQDGIHYNFGECLPASIAGRVWNDVNGDCIYEPGTDLPLAGVTIDLLNGQGQFVASTLTDAQGNYLFNQLPPGTYEVFEHQPAGYDEGMDMVGTVDGKVDGSNSATNLLSQIVLGSGVTGVNYNFCEYLPVSISGKVWNDVNGDCVYQPGTDLPLAGVQIDLLDTHGNAVLDDEGNAITTVTDSQGHYEFDDLDPGTYEVFEHQPAGYLQGMDMVGTVNGNTDGINGATNLLSQISLISGQNGVNYDFCEYLPGSISGKVWNDVNGDCVFQPETDIPLAGVQIDLLNSHGNAVLDDNGHAITAVTDNQGNYEFDNLDPGTYEVFEHQPAGYDQGMDMVGTIGGVTVGQVGGVDLLSKITLNSGANGINYNFCEYLPGSISGKVWNDVNGDCLYEPQTDLPLAGVQIDLMNSQGTVIATTTTNAQGNYEFDDLDPGTYEVFEHQPAGYHQGMDMVGTIGGVTVGQVGGLDLLSNITLTSGANGVDYDFCEYLPGSISGKVWNDVNGDCVYQPGTDIPLAGVQIDLLDAHGNAVLDDNGHAITTVTDNQGNYEFDDLDPGTYEVFEHQPAGYDQGMDMVGTIGGVTIGQVGGVDLLTKITLNSGANGINYNFCEYIPGSISGKVWNDINGDCIYEPETDLPLSGVQIDLLDSHGAVIATTTTNAEGNYEFDDLDPGTYEVFEHQPAGYDQGMDMVGTIGGVTVGKIGGVDLLSNITLTSGATGINYDFCEYIPGSISGKVWNDTNGDCVYEPETDLPLAGVKIDLLDSHGTLIASTTTDGQGNYIFDDLDPGTYEVFEHQPAGYLQGMDMVGSIGGTTVGQVGGLDLLSQITITSGANGINYDFCEYLPGKISGFVFQDGPPIVLPPGAPLPDVDAIRTGVRAPGDKPIPGVTLLLYDGLGNPVLNGQGQQLSAVTDANGFYQFTGLDDGTYIVREFQPAGFLDGIDTPGTTGGVAINHNTPPTAIPTLPFNPNFDAIVSISLGHGQTSAENNFSEVVVQRLGFIPPPPPAVAPPVFFLAGPAPQQIPTIVPPPFLPPPPVLDLGGGDALGFTWHLSVIDAGFPREPVAQYVAMNFANASLAQVDWSNLPTLDAEWILLDADGHEVHRHVIGLKNAIPIAGDFLGTGVDELGLYVEGQWFIDLNGNGVWDAGDLWAKLGTRDDKPVVGDWNGDGKADIGIFGPAWPRDPKAIQTDPGLPDPEDRLILKRKNNLPPAKDEAALGRRVLQPGQQGKVREDLIDHVFHFGVPLETPIVGDWTGAGIRRIGTFYQGTWTLDTDGDGRLTDHDAKFEFGQAGDIPVVGDWTGDGIEKVGVYRNGTWYLDTNNNHRLDAADRVVQLGQPGDVPVVGNLNGDGRATIGVYHVLDSSAAAAQTAAKPAPAGVK